MIARLTGLLGHAMTRSHSPLQERIALKDHRLAIRVTRHPYGAHPHVRETLLVGFSYTHPLRQEVLPP
jgi:hypothetical protein